MQKKARQGKARQGKARQGKARQGKVVYIANAGVEGHDTYSHIQSFELWFPHIPGLKPRYVIAYVGMNDTYSIPGLYEDELQESFSWKGYLKKNSALYLLYRYLRSWIIQLDPFYRQRFVRFDSEKFEWGGPVELTKEGKKRVWASVASYERNLRILVTKIKQWGARPILITQKEETYKVVGGKILEFHRISSSGDVETNDLTDHIMMKLNRVTLRVCQEMGGICIDLAKELDLNHADFYDSTHNTPSGTRKIGHYLYEKLKPYW